MSPSPGVVIRTKGEVSVMGTGDAGATRPGEVVTTGTEGALTPQAARTAAKLMPPPSVSTA
jgi:hypothetical protein